MYLDLEAAAARLLIFDPGVIHGLLQTPDYARALFFLASGADPADVSRNLELRRHRQERSLAIRPPPNSPRSSRRASSSSLSEDRKS